MRSLLGHAARLNVIGKNPAEGVRQLAGERRQRKLSDEELRRLGQVIRDMASEGEHPTGLAAIRLMLLSGFRRMEVLGLERLWVSPKENSVRLSRHQKRRADPGSWEDRDLLHQRCGRSRRFAAFPADWGHGHFVGVVWVLDRVCVKAGLKGVTPHVLRHTFASVAGDLGFSELTIAGLLGHSARGVTQGYVHLDAALGVAADRVSAEIEKMLDGRDTAKNPKKMIERTAAPSVAA